MGAIMWMGVATANSILIVSFAKERLADHGNALEAAIEAGFTRFRPVLMTALAMIIGMIPMALGLGDGGEQNAPLGRAVIGGLLCATVATLIFVPAVFSMFHGRRGADSIDTSMTSEAGAATRSHSRSNIDDNCTRKQEPETQARRYRPGAKAAARALGSHTYVILAAAAVIFIVVICVRLHQPQKGGGGPETVRRRQPRYPPSTWSIQKPALPPMKLCCREIRRRSPTRRSLRGPTAMSRAGTFDIGAHVKKGQLLAEIETPEVDQQLHQARADLKTAQANLRQAKITADRWQALLKTNSVSKQETDRASSNFHAMKATVDSNASNVRRLGGTAGVSEDLCSVRRRDHGAQHGYRRA